MPRALFTIQYLGTRYAGWQFQENALSIQQVIEDVLATLCKQPVRVDGAGRTDSGVHAIAQRAHADIPIDIDSRGLMLGMNDRLPTDIRIRGVEWVADDFHCRFVPSVKTYLYRIWNDQVADVFQAPTHAYVRQPLDTVRMSEAATVLVGYHDFRAFTVRAPTVSSTWRTIETLGIERDRARVSMTIRANGFLRFMVRRIAGSLIEIGREKQPSSIVADSLEPGFMEARWTAPAHGLTLVSIDY